MPAREGSKEEESDESEDDGNDTADIVSWKIRRTSEQDNAYRR